MTSSLSTSAGPVTVVIVDDHELLREGVKRSLSNDGNIQVVGEAVDCTQAITLIGQLQPDVVILDIRLRDGNEMDVSRAARVVAPNTKIVVLSAYDDDGYVVALAKLGVAGYLLKTASAGDLNRAVHSAAAGLIVFAQGVANKLAGLLEKRDPVVPQGALGNGKLTNRESEVLRYLARGCRNAEIAHAMGIAVKTVEEHVEHVLLKLGAKSRTEAVLVALRTGLLGDIPSYGRRGLL